MKKLTIFLGVVLAIMLIAAGLYYGGGTLRAQTQVRTANADAYPSIYASIHQILLSGTAHQRFSDAIPDSPEGCRLVDITVDLTNYGFIPAEWLHTECTAQPGDIAVYSLTGEGADVPAHGSGQVNLKLITTGAADAPREIAIE